jgi:ferredoxin
MAYVITSDCIDCHRCESVCPTGSITKNEQHYHINSELCHDCVGHYSVPQCWAVCPTNAGCIPDCADSSESCEFPLAYSTDENADYWQHWFETYNRLIWQLKHNQPSDYWQQWFDRYSQALSRQLHPPKLVGANP